MRWFLCAVLALVGCKKSPEPVVLPPPPVEVASPAAAPAFWTWVGAHVDALKAVKTGHEPVTEELARELEKIAPGLVFELGVGNGVLELIISADGRKALFPVVTKLVDAAPQLPDLKVVAFRPRRAMEGFSMQVRDTTLAGKDLWFVAGEDPSRKGMLGVDVFIVGMRGEHDEALENAAFMMLEGTVGEFDLETKIGEVQFKPAPGKLELPLKPLKELPATVDAWK